MDFYMKLSKAEMRGKPTRGRRNQMLHILANDGGNVALKRATENREGFLDFSCSQADQRDPWCAKFHMNRCNESPLWGENADFWLVSKFNTGSLPLRGILPVKTC